MQIDRVLGNVGVLYVGEYDPEKHYEYLNCATHNGSSYTCVNPDGVTGIEPGTTDDWQLSAKKGDVGPVGPKPVNGVDYNTPEEKEEFKNEVVSTATTEVKQNIVTIKEEAIQEFNSNASTKTNEYNDNTTTKLQEYNTNASTKIEEYNSNATQKTNTFNGNATTQTETFNNNATSKTNDFNSNASTKTDEFNTNYEEKLESINEASTSIEQERIISDGKYARALKTQVTDVESTQIYAENDVVDDLVINGVELTQETREGYNKFNIDTIVENKYIDGRYQNVTYGELFGSSDSNTSDYIEVKASKSYLLTYDYDTLMNTGNRGFVFYNTNKEVINQEKDTLYNPSNKSNIFTAPNQDGYLRFSYDINCTNIQLIEGTEEKQYEQYGASPSLDFPSEIKVSDEQKILICRKNLIKSIQYMNNLDRYGWVLRFEAPLKPNTEYTIGLIGTKDNKYYLAEDFVVNGGPGFTVTMTGTMQYITFTTKENISVSPTYVENEGGYILFKNIINQPNNHIFEDVILVEGTVNEAYEPYEGQDISIPIQNLAIGDYSDIIDRENEKQDKFIVELMLDGTENWIASGSNDITNSFQLNLNYEIENYIGICNCLKTGVAGNVEKFSPLGTSLYIAVNKKRASTVEEFKALLAQLYSSGKPMKFYLIRKSASKESLTKEVKDELDKFKLYKDLNNVFIDNGSLSFKYNKSLLRVFKEQSELSASLLERVQALEAAQVNSVGGN